MDLSPSFYCGFTGPKGKGPACLLHPRVRSLSVLLTQLRTSRQDPVPWWAERMKAWFLSPCRAVSHLLPSIDAGKAGSVLASELEKPIPITGPAEVASFYRQLGCELKRAVKFTSSTESSWPRHSNSQAALPSLPLPVTSAGDPISSTTAGRAHEARACLVLPEFSSGRSIHPLVCCWFLNPSIRLWVWVPLLF